MDYTTVSVARVVGAATGVGVLSSVLPETSSGWPIVALICGAAGGAILVSLLVSTIYKRVSS